MTPRESTSADARRSTSCRFGDFVLDLEAGFLRRNGQEVPLRPKTFDVLKYLVLHHGRLIPKNELVEAVWQSTAVTDNSLSQCLFEIRRALDDETLIRTVARRGYIFDSPVSLVVRDSFRPQPEAVPAPATVRNVRWRPRARFRRVGVIVLVLAAAMTGLGYRMWFATPRVPSLVFTQLTDFTDSAMAPAVSPDGRMLAFIRSDSAFLTPGQVWAKLLPNGEPVQVTNVRGNKYGLAFSPDGSRIAFTVAWPNPDWETFTVSPLGGEEAQLMLRNAAGLTWIDAGHVLFSEVRTGMHMGIVTSRANRSEQRELYFPGHERSMAHYSFLSPDRKSILIVEMIDIQSWVSCRLASFDGRIPPREVGPQGGCTGAGWSPDGRWMYFAVEVDGRRHLWRQRFPDGEPQQITFGPNDEDGVAVFPDGSLATSVGVTDSAVWLRDAKGDRPLTSMGSASPMVSRGMSSRPVFSRDGSYVYYLLHGDSMGPLTELWRYQVATGRREAVVTGFAITDYDVANDSPEVVFSTQPSGTSSEIWLAGLDRNTSPRRIASSGEASPHFGPTGEILFRLSDGVTNYIARMNRDGSGRAKVASSPVSTVMGISSDRKWVIAMAPFQDTRGDHMATIAVPVGGGNPRQICSEFCIPQWAPGGRYMYLPTAGKTLAIPLPPGEALPKAQGDLAVRGYAADIPGAHVIEGGDESSDYRVRGLSPSPDPATFAYVRTSVHHNLYQIHFR